MTTWDDFTHGLTRTLFELQPGSYVIIEPVNAPDTGWVQFRTAHDVPDLLLQCRNNNDPEPLHQQRTSTGWTAEDRMHWSRNLTWPAYSSEYTEHAQALTAVLHEQVEAPDQLAYTAWRDPYTDPDGRVITDSSQLQPTLPPPPHHPHQPMTHSRSSPTNERNHSPAAGGPWDKTWGRE